MKITKEIMQKIEGEAQLELGWERGKVVSSKVKFFSYRGMEEIIQGRSPLDALVLTPRVCGICGHAQLMACVHALESVYENCGIKLEISSKAKMLRDVTLDAEIIQNHLKWLYFIIMPILYSMEKKTFSKNKIFKALNVATIATKLIATFAGQWPHNSYMIPGGVVCDPTYVEIFQAKSYIDEIISFFEEEIIQANIEEIVSMETLKDLLLKEGLIKDMFYIMKNHNILDIGKSHDRFIAFGSNSIFKSAKSIKTIVGDIDVKYMEEQSLDFTYAKNVLYGGNFYEVGALSRAMISKRTLAKSIHRTYKDSILNRMIMKIMEIAYLAVHIKECLDKIDITEPSFIRPQVEIEDLEGIGDGFAEAARGSLYHGVQIKDAKISKYDIITPTQWNLGNSIDKDKSSTIQKALYGLENENTISLVFRSFDECSVCTTH